MYDKKKDICISHMREKKKRKLKRISITSNMKSFYLYEDFRLTDANE